MKLEFWTGVATGHATKYLFEEIGQDALEEPNLKVYSQMDEGTGNIALNSALTLERSLKFNGARWIPSTAPVRPEHSSRV